MIKRHLAKIFTLAFLAGFLVYGLQNQDMFDALAKVSVIALLLVAAGRIAIFVSNGLFTKWTAEAFTRKLTTGEGIYVGILSAIGNFFGPLLGGASIRAVYLKKIHNVSYSHFTSMLMVYYLILFFINGLAVLVSLLWLPRTAQTNGLLLFFGLWLAGLLLLMIVRLPQRQKLHRLDKALAGKIIKIIYDVEHGWLLLLRNRRMLVKMFSLAILSYIASFFISLVEFRALDINIGLAALGLYTAVVVISILVSLTPGAIGIREAMLFLVASTIGVSNTQILQVAVIDRGVLFVLLLGLFAITRSRRLKKKFTAREIAV
ncbi:flippase-like domain-containing protein [Candidatus Saccharibacteria bacterium]|nr:flippase-like domain-containing protein [Candidatus Saccharibacteria bacterium]